MITAVNGFGGIKLEMVSLGASAVFPNPKGTGTIKFRPEGWERETANGKTLSRKKVRAIIGVYFENFEDTDYLLIEELVTIFNWHWATGEAILVYPKWNPDSVNSQGYECRLMSEVAIEDLSERLISGQTCELSFEGVQLMDMMPFHTDSSAPKVLVTDDNLIIRTDDDKKIVII